MRNKFIPFRYVGHARRYARCQSELMRAGGNRLCSERRAQAERAKSDRGVTGDCGGGGGVPVVCGNGTDALRRCTWRIRNGRPRGAREDLVDTDIDIYVCLCMSLSLDRYFVYILIDGGGGRAKANARSKGWIEV